MRSYETVVFQQKENETKEKFFQRVGEQLRLLLEEGYLAVVRYDEPGLGIVVIEFEHNDLLEYYGCSQPVWITPKEEEELAHIREEVG